jgi:hypothetical protein
LGWVFDWLLGNHPRFDWRASGLWRTASQMHHRQGGFSCAQAEGWVTVLAADPSQHGTRIDMTRITWERAQKSTSIGSREQRH